MAGYTRKTTAKSKPSKPPKTPPKKPVKKPGSWKPSGSVNPADEGL
jgi:hypothetical protein